MFSIGNFTDLISRISNVLDSSSKGVDVDLKSTLKDLELIKTKGNIVSLIKPMIIEPNIIVSKELRTLDIIDNINDIDLSIFTTLYVQAFETITKLHGLNANTAINLLSSNNTTLLNDASLSMDYITGLMDGGSIALESILSGDVKRGSHALNKASKVNTSKDEIIPALMSRQVMLSVHVGQVNSDGKGNLIKVLIEIPVTIRANIVYTDTANVVNMVNTKGIDKGFFARVDEFRSGAISLADLVLAGDIVDEYKSHKLKDKDGLMELISKKSVIRNLKSITSSGLMAFGNRYNIYVIAKQHVATIERALKGKLSKEKYKDIFLDSTMGMILTIVDEDYERTITYISELKGSTDIGFKTLNKQGKNAGSDNMTEMFKMITSGRGLQL